MLLRVTWRSSGARYREVKKLENSISTLENRVNAIVAMLARLEGQMHLSVELFIAFNLPTSIAVIGILLRTVFV